MRMTITVTITVAEKVKPLKKKRERDVVEEKKFREGFKSWAVLK